MRKLIIALFLMAVITGNSQAADPLRPTTATAPSSIIMQAFYWDAWPWCPDMNWYCVIAEQAPAMREAGITHFWFPPPTKDWYGRGGMGYGLFDHFDIGQYYQKGTIATRWGYKHQLQHAAAVAGNVLLDLVPNHMIGGDLMYDPFDSTYRWQRFEYVHDYFHKTVDHFFPCPIVGDDPFPPLMGEELNHAHPEVWHGIRHWAKWLKATVGNVSGFRIDGAKHFCWYMSREIGTIGCSIAEYWCTRDNILKHIAHTGNFAFDFWLYWTMRTGRAGDLHWAGLMSDKGISFVANHDTDTIPQKVRAYGFIMYIPPIPCVFWPDWFNPYLQPAIKRAMAARNAHNFSGTYTKYISADGHLIIFGNAGGVFGVFNSGPDWAGGRVQLKPNTTYVAIAWGGYDDAQPMPVTTDAYGWVELRASGGGFAYYYAPSPNRPH
ncbi:hypothetical protein LR013_00615 [candidate division NPL-UPA2 bacterium]|nr:hypothetical protein [candidate division NPL-UPA2 bacterium]